MPNQPRQLANNSKNDEWYTPPEIISLVKQAMGGCIDLDPASCDRAQDIVKANKYYTNKDNGLTKPWIAKNVFLNPPYSHLSKKKRREGSISWLEHFVSEYNNISTGIYRWHGQPYRDYYLRCNGYCRP